MITDGERSGGEYELIKNKRSYTRIISQEPERLEEISLKFAHMARELHAKETDTTRLCSYKQRIERFYREKNRVPEEYKQRALNFLETVPDTPRCVHGDLHIGTSDPQTIGEAIKHLLPYYATKVPYMFDMAFNAPMPDVALQKNVNLLLRS